MICKECGEEYRAAYYENCPECGTSAEESAKEFRPESRDLPEVVSELATLRADLAESQAQVERMRAALEAAVPKLEEMAERQNWRESMPILENAKAILVLTPSDALRAVKLEVARQAFHEALQGHNVWSSQRKSHDEMWQQSAIARELEATPSPPKP